MPLPVRPPSFRQSITFVLDACRAGATPHASPAARQVAATIASTRPSIEYSIQ